MIGDELLAIPITESFSYTIKGYFPEGIWYDWKIGEYVKSPDKNGRKDIEVRS